jgi:uncharacterized protein (PEP-CTERM system associated)
MLRLIRTKGRYPKDRRSKADREPNGAALVLLAVIALPGAAWSQGTAGLDIASTVKLSASLSVSEVYTSNVNLTSNSRSDLITQVSPGIRITSKGGRIQGSLDYSLTEQLYARNSSGRRSQNTLNASGNAELVDNWAFVDFGGAVGQQSISAFGAPTGDGSAINANSTEVATFRVSPYVRGRLGSAAEYLARYSLSSSKSDSGTVSDVDTSDLSLSLRGTGARRGLGWSLEASRQKVDYSLGRSTSSSRFGGNIGYPIDERFGVYLRANRESNDFVTATAANKSFVAAGLNWTPNDELKVSVDRNNGGVLGIDAAWNPTNRTSLSVFREQRLFGTTHRIALAYRTPNTAWTFSSSKTANTDSGPTSGFKAVDLYTVLVDQFAVTELDPLKREQFASALQANGIRPGITALVDFQSSAVYLQRQNQLSAALFGARNTVTVVLSRGSSNRLDTQTSAIDDLSTSSSVDQSGFSINVSHRFSPQTVLNFLVSRQSTSGSAAQADTTSRSMLLNLTTRLTKDTSAGIGLRRAVFDSATNPYTETAVTGNLNVQF